MGNLRLPSQPRYVGIMSYEYHLANTIERTKGAAMRVIGTITVATYHVQLLPVRTLDRGELMVSCKMGTGGKEHHGP